MIFVDRVQCSGIDEEDRRGSAIINDPKIDACAILFSFLTSSADGIDRVCNEVAAAAVDALL